MLILWKLMWWAKKGGVNPQKNPATLYFFDEQEWKDAHLQS